MESIFRTKLELSTPFTIECLNDIEIKCPIDGAYRYAWCNDEQNGQLCRLFFCRVIPHHLTIINVSKLAVKRDGKLFDFGYKIQPHYYVAFDFETKYPIPKTLAKLIIAIKQWKTSREVGC